MKLIAIINFINWFYFWIKIHYWYNVIFFCVYILYTRSFAPLKNWMKGSFFGKDMDEVHTNQRGIAHTHRNKAYNVWANNNHLEWSRWAILMLWRKTEYMIHERWALIPACKRIQNIMSYFCPIVPSYGIIEPDDYRSIVYDNDMPVKNEEFLLPVCKAFIENQVAYEIVINGWSLDVNQTPIEPTEQNKKCSISEKKGG